jgi:hypothetical protein
LAEKVGLRPDIPPQLSRLADEGDRSGALAAHRLSAARGEAPICDMLAKVSQNVGARGGARDYRVAQHVALSLDRANQLNDPDMTAFCAEGKYEETVVALGTLTKVPLNLQTTRWTAIGPIRCESCARPLASAGRR